MWNAPRPAMVSDGGFVAREQSNTDDTNQRKLPDRLGAAIPSSRRTKCSLFLYGELNGVGTDPGRFS